MFCLPITTIPIYTTLRDLCASIVYRLLAKIGKIPSLHLVSLDNVALLGMSKENYYLRSNFIFNIHIKFMKIY